VGKSEVVCVWDLRALDAVLFSLLLVCLKKISHTEKQLGSLDQSRVNEPRSLGFCGAFPGVGTQHFHLVGEEHLCSQGAAAS
jgi:hypothetical protein